MAVGKVTIAKLQGLQGWIWDTQCTGFGARRQTNGVFYYVRYRHNGAQIVKSIGRHGAPWTPDTARNKARELLGVVAGGADPFAPSLATETFGTEIDRYLERKKASLKPRSFIETERYLRDYALPVHKLRLAQIDRRTIAVLLGQIETSSGATTRNRLRSTLSAFYAWTIAEGLTEINPVLATAKADEGGGRERVLAEEELKALSSALGTGSFADTIRLLLLTGARRNEIGLLKWSEVDVARKLIILPPHRVKNDREHSLPLSSQALTIIERIPRRNSTDFVFNDRGFQDWNRAKRKLDERLRIAPWRLHDLRRTCATGMAELGVQPHIIEAVLNHVSGHKAGVAGIYNRARYAEEMRNALQLWADHLEALIVGPRKQPVSIGLMERAFAVARGGKIVPEEDLANLARQLKNNVTR